LENLKWDSIAGKAEETLREIPCKKETCRDARNRLLAISTSNPMTLQQAIIPLSSLEFRC
jgi:hypothetical protein